MRHIKFSSIGVGVISYQDNLDLTTAQGRLLFHIIGAMAEFERELIRERVKAGLENARREGKRLGRKPVAPIDIEKAIQLHQQDPLLSIRTIAKKTKLSKSLVGKVLKEQIGMVSC